MSNTLYMSEEELFGKVDFEQLKEYLNGWDDATFIEEYVEYFKREYVEMFLNR